MMEIIKEAKTVDAAIAAALEELKCDEEDVVIDILQQPSKGIFGMAKMAKVKVKYINANVKEGMEHHHKVMASESKEPSDLEKEGKKVLHKVLTLMGFQTATIKSRHDNENIFLDITSDSEGLLIGKHGQTISALQYLVNRMIKDENNKELRYIVDIGSYRVRHKNILEKTAKKVAARVIESHQQEALQPMGAFDRRIVHMILKDNEDVMTYSTGEKQYRHVVIAPKGTIPNEGDIKEAEEDKSEE